MSWSVVVGVEYVHMLIYQD